LVHNKLRITLLAAALLTFGAIANAQYGAPNGPYQPGRVEELIQKIHADLVAGYASWHVTGGDRHRLDEAEKNLHKFAERWRVGEFDKGRLDGSIHSIQKIINDNHLIGPARDNLWADVERLREMRAAYDRREIGRW
jgi:hypothetical protein